MRRVLCALLLLAACGDDNPNRHLDGGMDADIDAPDAMPEPVTITVSINGVPQPGIQTYFQAADSTLVAAPLTDAAGQATARLDHGGFVTAIEPFVMPTGVSEKIVRSFAGVKPGDMLVLDGPLTTVTQMTVSGPADSDASANYYEMSTPCGSTITAASAGAPMTTLVLDGCGAKTDLLLMSRDSITTVLRYIYAPDLNVSEGGTLDVTGVSYASPTSRTYTYNNVPAAFTPVRVADSPVSPKGRFNPIVINATGSPRTATQPVPTFTGATSVIEASSEDGFVRQTLIDWGPSTTPFTTDWSGRALAPLTVIPRWDQASHTIVWSEAPGIQPDYTYVRASTYRATPGVNVVWEIVGPHAAGSLEFPLLPPGGTFDYNFASGDTVSMDDVRVLKVPGGWDAVRAHAFGDGALIPIVGATGSAAAEEFAAALLRAPRR